MNSVLIGTHQMDTEFGLYLPEYSIPAPVPQTKFINVIGRDGAVDLSNAFGSVHYNSREWNLDFKHFDPVNWHTISSSVFNAIHGKRLDFTFDDDPNYHWTGRFIVQDYTSKNGCGTLKVRVMADPFKYKNTQTTVSSSVPVNEQTLTGDVVTINNNKAYEVNSLGVSLSPIQDLHGYSSPWPAGGGVNLLPPMVDGTYEGNGVKAVVVNGVATLSGTTTASGNAFIVPLAESFTVPSGCYYHLGNSVANGSLAPTIENGNNTSENINYSCSPANRISPELSSKVGQTWTRIRFYIGNGVTISGTYAPMMCLDNTARDFSPYSNICPITGRTGLTVYRTGKNLLDPSLLQVFNSKKYISTVSYATQGTVKVQGDTSYALSRKSALADGKIYYYDAFGNPISDAIISSTNPFYFTTPPNCATIGFYVAVDSSGSLNSPQDAEPQLELGSTATTYEPYNGNTYAVDWTTEAGTVYGGSLDVVTGVLTVDRASVDLGTLSWQTATTAVTGKSRHRAEVSGIKPASSASSVANILCSQYKSASWNATYNAVENCIGVATSNDRICVFDDALSTLSGAAFKTAMNGVQLVYTLATPLTYQLTAQEVELLTGTNNIWSEGQVSVVITEPIVINNPTLPVVPTVTASAPMTLRWNAQSYSMDAGTRVIPQLTLQTGNNPIYVDGEGTISFAFSEASL